MAICFFNLKFHYPNGNVLFVCAELEQGPWMAQLKSAIFQRGRAILLRIISRGEVVQFPKSWRTKFAISAPIFRPKASIPGPVFRPCFHKLFSVRELIWVITFSKWSQNIMIQPFQSIGRLSSSGLKRQIRSFVHQLSPLKTLLDFNHNGYLILHLIFHAKPGIPFCLQR